MNLKTPVQLGLALGVLLAASGRAQVSSANEPAVEAPVPYASINQLNSMLTRLEQTSQAAQLDLAKLRVDRWKADSGNKRQTQANVESVSRNLHDALPGIIGELRSSPESLISTFKLYRNLDALYDVLGSVVESAGAFGSKDEFQSLSNDLTELENARRTFADRMETLAGSKEVELTRLRNQLRSAQAAVVSSPPKKVVVDDNTPPAKPRKKPVPKPSSAATPKSQ
jgi:dsDNA-specific endonuclease/ATPase MutS2